MAKKVLEGEIVEDKANIRAKNNNFEFFENNLITKFPGWRLLFCLVPIVGLLFAMAWFYLYKKSQRVDIIFPVIGIIIGLFSTTTFIILRFILKAIF
jgi:hypothetical protein